jgi:hypothetical protein
MDHGSERRAEQAGYIAVEFIQDEDAPFCGRARVGADPGLITLNYGVEGCATTCGPFAPHIVAHEIGHAMGYWHVPHGDVMNTLWYGRDCARTALSSVERHHSRIAYARPPGNIDTDWDPVSAALLQAPAGPPPVVSCR